MHLRKLVVLCTSIALVGLSGAGEASDTRRLRPGDATFWTGPFVEAATTDSWTYRFELTESAYRLRVGIDHPEVDDDYSVDLFAPGGDSRSASAGGGLYSNELLLERPRPGVYRAVVSGQDVTDSNFRLRVKLEAKEPSLGVRSGPVLPNLQVLPPHEASLLFPATNGTTDPPQGVDLLGAESCHPEEHAEDLAVRCLRFAFGVRNTGRGPMDLYYEGASAVSDGILYQRVARVDGSTFVREAGTARFHKTHGHYHHTAAIGLQLLKVVDTKRGKLEPAGEPRTKGFAHREELLREWDTFYPTLTLNGFGLGAGWADIYEWDRPGNYIDFGTNGDGRYVVRMQADPVDGVLESNEQDNFGYTYLEVAGSEVTMLEAGRGRDPWDPCRIVVGFGGHADPKRGPRPSGCAPDTT